MNNADNSLFKAFLWNTVPWDLMEFLADPLSLRVYGGIDVVSHDRHVDVGSGEMQYTVAVTFRVMHISILPLPFNWLTKPDEIYSKWKKISEGQGKCQLNQAPLLNEDILSLVINIVQPHIDLASFKIILSDLLLKLRSACLDFFPLAVIWH